MRTRSDVLFLDANVLYSASCRDLLIEAALAGLCDCRWSPQVLAETRRALLRQRPDLQTTQLDRLFRLLDSACPQALAHLRIACKLPLDSQVDIADRHVVESARAAGASFIVTFNLRHFPQSELRPFGLMVVSPDLWLSRKLKTNPVVIRQIVERCRQRLRHPPFSPAEYRNAMRQSGLASFVALLG